MKYRFAGIEKRLAIGVYPAVTLAEAREKREQAKKQLANNIDPSAAKQERKQKAALTAATTFELVAREWHEHNREKWTPAYGKDILHRLEMDIFPQIGKWPIADIRPVKMLEALRQIEKRGALEMAKRSKQYCSQIFRYAVIIERAERDPTVDLKDALKPIKRGHFAALEPDELPDFLNRTIKDATVKRYHYSSHDQLKQHLQSFVMAYNFAKRLKNPIGLTPYEYICSIWKKDQKRFNASPVSPLHFTVELNN